MLQLKKSLCMIILHTYTEFKDQGQSKISQGQRIQISQYEQYILYKVNELREKNKEKNGRNTMLFFDCFSFISIQTLFCFSHLFRLFLSYDKKIALHMMVNSSVIQHDFCMI